MDDFNAGPHSFNVILNSFDPQVITSSNECSFKTILGKAIEFTSEEWEVGLKQIIFKPTLQTFHSDSTVHAVFLKHDGTITNLVFNVESSKARFDSKVDVAAQFNEYVPQELWSQIKFSYDSSKKRF